MIFSRPIHPQLQVTCALVLFAILWLTQLAGVSLVPPVDNIEQLTWVKSLKSSP